MAENNPATPLSAEAIKGFPKISRLEHWKYLIKLRASQWWRRQRGIIRLTGPGSRCLACGSKDYYYRLGCRCWSDKAKVILPHLRTLEWGWFMETTGKDKCAEFASNYELLEMVRVGRHVEHPDGRRVTLSDFEGEDV